MNFKINTPKTLLLLILLAGSEMARGQGTVFTYQGRFLDGGSPATGTNYDIRFSLYDALINGNQLGNLQVTGVSVSNGLFTVPLNFGQQPFSGSNLWVELAVQKNGGGFFILTPRQPLTSTPYAIMANTASNLSGPLPPTALSGVYSGAVSFTNGGNAFTGSHSGNGGGLTNLNGSQVTSGTVPDARLSTNVALLNANETFSGTVQFTGPLTSFTSGANSNAFSATNTAAAGNSGGSGIFGSTSQAAGGGVSGKNLNANGTGIVAIGNGTLGRELSVGSGLAADGSVWGVYARSEGTALPAGAVYADLGGPSPNTVAVSYFDGATLYKILGNGTVSTLVSDKENKTRVMFAPEAPEVLFEDYGSGQLVNGKAHIALDPVFSANIMVDKSHALRVFVQVENECKGVYVTNKSDGGFDVVELGGGVSSAQFSWHAVGNRADEETGTTAPGPAQAGKGRQVSHYTNLRFPVKTDKQTVWHPVKSQSP